MRLGTTNISGQIKKNPDTAGILTVFQENDIKLTGSEETFSPSYNKKQKQERNKLEGELQKQGAYDGGNYRIKEIKSKGGELHYDFFSYFDNIYLGEHPEVEYSQGYSVGSLIKIGEGDNACYVFGVKNDKPQLIGGIAERQENDTCASNVLYREMGEELGIGPKDIKELGFLSHNTTPANRVSTLGYTALSSNITKEKLGNIFNSIPNPEHSRILFITQRSLINLIEKDMGYDRFPVIPEVLQKHDKIRT